MTARRTAAVGLSGATASGRPTPWLVRFRDHRLRSGLFPDAFSPLDRHLRLFTAAARLARDAAVPEPRDGPVVEPSRPALLGLPAGNRS